MNSQIYSAGIVLIPLLVIWFFPHLLSSSGIILLITVAYGMLVTRVLKITAQYAVLHWGVNRQGVMFLALLLLLCGVAILYYAWRESTWVYATVGWIASFAGFDITWSAYRKQLGRLGQTMLLSLEYVVVALFALALFGGYLPNSPVGQMNIEYRGLRGESLLFIAIVMLAAEVVHIAVVSLRRSVCVSFLGK